MAENYYGRFQTFLSDISVNHLLEVTMGYQDSLDGIAAVNEWVKKNAKSNADFIKFDDIFGCCLNAQETLWFNLSWQIGWALGAVQGLKAQGLDIPESISCLAAVFNEVMHAEKLSKGGSEDG